MSDGSMVEAPRASTAEYRNKSKEERRKEMENWRPDRSVPFKVVNIRLKTDPAQRMHHLLMVVVQKSLYHLEHTAPPAAKRMPDAVIQLDATLLKRMEDFESSIQNELARLRHVADNAGITDMLEYTDPAEVKAVQYTREGGRFISFVKALDELVMLADTLRFEDCIKRTERTRLVATHRNALVKLGRELHNIHVTLLRLVRQHDRQQRMEQHGEHADQAHASAAVAHEDDDALNTESALELADSEAEEHDPGEEAPARKPRKQRAAAAPVTVTAPDAPAAVTATA